MTSACQLSQWGTSIPNYNKCFVHLSKLVQQITSLRMFSSKKFIHLYMIKYFATSSKILSDVTKYSVTILRSGHQKTFKNIPCCSHAQAHNIMSLEILHNFFKKMMINQAQCYDLIVVQIRHMLSTKTLLIVKFFILCLQMHIQQK